MAVAVVGAQVQPHADARDRDVALLLLARQHFAQVVVEVVRIVGEMGRAVHRRAVGDHEQQLAFLAARAQPRAGPVHGLAVDAFAEQLGPQQRGHRRARAAPGRARGLEHQVAAFVEPARVRGPARAQPVALRAAAVPGTGGEAQHFAGHAGLLEGAREHVDQHRDRFGMLLHRARAIDEEADHAIGQRLLALDAEQPPLGRRGHEPG